MQGAVSNNLSLAILGNKEPKLGESLGKNSELSANNEENASFEQLVAEQLNPKYAPGFIGSGGSLQQGAQINSINLNELLGKDLPHGNRQAVILEELLAAQGKSVGNSPNDSVLPDELTGIRLNTRGQPEELLFGMKNTGTAKNDPDSLLGMAGDNRFARNLLFQNYTNNLLANQTAQSESINGNKVVNQSFLELMESGAALSKSDTLAIMKQNDVSLKSLLNASSNDGVNQIDALRTETNGINANITSSTGSKPTISMALPLTNSPAWQQSFGEKVMWMINQNIQSAEIKLNPPELGRLDVKITMQLDQASIQFSSQNQHVREIIESALPRLREMFGDSGLNLADVDVSDKSFAAKDNRNLFSENDQPNTPGTENEGHAKSGDSEDIIEQHILHSSDTVRIDFYA